MGIINLYKEHPLTNELEIIGAITEDQLDCLMDNLESDLEENEEYLLNRDNIEYLINQNADKSLIALLEKALAGIKEGINILYLEE